MSGQALTEKADQRCAGQLYDPNNRRFQERDWHLTFDGEDSESNKFNRIPKNGEWTLINPVLEAIASKNYTEAKTYFERAWNNRAELDPKTLQSIQDQLNYLTMSKPMPAAGAGNGPVRQVAQTIDLNDASSQQTATFKELQSEIFKERANAERMLETDPRSALGKNDIATWTSRSIET